jgi:hypothetical protein
LISDNQESAMAAARGKARQDKRTPLVINRDNLRLMPNTPLIRARPQYMPYDGQATDDEPTRRAYVEGRGMNKRPRIVNSAAEPEVYDIGRCSKDELVTFAMDTYGFALDPAKDVRILRKEFAAYVETVVGQPLS